MILGGPNEQPALGAGGAITPLCNPSATAEELARLLTDRDWYSQCANALGERIRIHYDKLTLDRTYRAIYDKYGSVEDQWPASALNYAS
jgi:hypothetical protein